MDVITEKTLFELNFSSDSDRCHYMGSGMYHFQVDNFVVPETENFKIGLKNLEIPKFKKRISFKIFLGAKHDTIKEESLKTYETSYHSLAELCKYVETIANQSLVIHRNTCIDFSYPEKSSNHFCLDMTSLPKTIHLQYIENKVVIEIHNDLKLIMSCNLAYIFGLKVNVCVDLVGVVELLDNHYISDGYVYFLDEKKTRFILVMYDIIRSYVIMANGDRLSVFYECNLKDYKLELSKLLTVKKLLSCNISELKFSVLDGNMNPYICSLNNETPLKFSIVVFE